ncbi:MAG: ribonuclease P protein component [Clostridia bacterium]|nr:ribonuclease P protein component [Clostridia bacterium]
MSKLPVLTKNNEFQRVYSKGKYSASAFLVIYVLPNRFEKTRVGITTSKKVGNAITRNRMRRLIRENLRYLSDRLIRGIDLVIVARKAEDTANAEIIGKELRYLLHKMDVLDREKEC